MSVLNQYIFYDIFVKNVWAVVEKVELIVIYKNEKMNLALNVYRKIG
jgi:hypothetical protein